MDLNIAPALTAALLATMATACNRDVCKEAEVVARTTCNADIATGARPSTPDAVRFAEVACAEIGRLVQEDCRSSSGSFLPPKDLKGIAIGDHCRSHSARLWLATREVRDASLESRGAFAAVGGSLGPEARDLLVSSIKANVGLYYWCAGDKVESGTRMERVATPPDPAQDDKALIAEFRAGNGTLWTRDVNRRAKESADTLPKVAVVSGLNIVLAGAYDGAYMSYRFNFGSDRPVQMFQWNPDAKSVLLEFVELGWEEGDRLELHGVTRPIQFNFTSTESTPWLVFNMPETTARRLKPRIMDSSNKFTLEIMFRPSPSRSISGRYHYFVKGNAGQGNIVAYRVVDLKGELIGWLSPRSPWGDATYAPASYMTAQ